MTANQLDAFHALADPNRREILMMLSKEKQTINNIAENFSISRPAVSKHIKVLYNTGFIIIEEKGRERYCILNQAGFNEVKTWMDYFEKYWLKELRSLDAYLKKNHQVKAKKKGK